MSNGARLTLEFNAKSRAIHRQEQRRQHISHSSHSGHHSYGDSGAQSHHNHAGSHSHQRFRSRQTNHASLMQPETDELSTESSVAAYQRFTHQLQKAQRLKHRQQQPDFGTTKIEDETDFDENHNENTTQQARGFRAIYRFVTGKLRLLILSLIPSFHDPTNFCFFSSVFCLFVSLLSFFKFAILWFFPMFSSIFCKLLFTFILL